MRLKPLDVSLEGTRKRAMKYVQVVWALVGVGLIYMSISLVVVVSLIRANDELCDSRQNSRTAYRTLFMQTDDWSYDDQVFLDTNLPAELHC